MTYKYHMGSLCLLLLGFMVSCKNRESPSAVQSEGRVFLESPFDLYENESSSEYRLFAPNLGQWQGQSCVKGVFLHSYEASGSVDSGQGHCQQSTLEFVCETGDKCVHETEEIKLAKRGDNKFLSYKNDEYRALGLSFTPESLASCSVPLEATWSAGQKRGFYDIPLCPEIRGGAEGPSEKPTPTPTPRPGRPLPPKGGLYGKHDTKLIFLKPLLKESDIFRGTRCVSGFSVAEIETRDRVYSHCGAATDFHCDGAGNQTCQTQDGQKTLKIDNGLISLRHIGHDFFYYTVRPEVYNGCDFQKEDLAWCGWEAETRLPEPELQASSPLKSGVYKGVATEFYSWDAPQAMRSTGNPHMIYVYHTEKRIWRNGLEGMPPDRTYCWTKGHPLTRIAPNTYANQSRTVRILSPTSYETQWVGSTGRTSWEKFTYRPRSSWPSYQIEDMVIAHSYRDAMPVICGEWSPRTRSGFPRTLLQGVPLPQEPDLSPQPEGVCTCEHFPRNPSFGRLVGFTERWQYVKHFERPLNSVQPCHDWCMEILRSNPDCRNPHLRHTNLVRGNVNEYRFHDYFRCW